MKKKSIASLAATVALLLSANSFAEQGAIYASQPHIAYEIKVLENGRVIRAITMSAIPGRSSTSKVGQQVSYLAACDSTNEVLSCSHGTVWDGIELTPAL
ncbi:MAG: hypothetical protein ACREYA_01875, partial [Cupriavidus necator]